LGDIALAGGGEIRTGPFGSQLHRHEYTDALDGVPVVMPLNMVGGRVDRDGIARVSAAKAAQMSAHVTRRGDVLLSRRGDIGRYCLIDDAAAGALCGTGSLRVSLQDTELLPEYLCMYLETPAGLHELQGKAVGSTMPNINSSIVGSLELPLPPLPTQRKIAAILSVYDDLIENNNRRIQILEEMAQRIYREWFVDFRYPGHEHVPLVDSELGPAPESWRVEMLSSVCDRIQAGGTPSRGAPVFWDGGEVNWFTTSELQDGFLFASVERVTQAAVASGRVRMFDAGTVLLAIYGASIGRLGVLTQTAACNQAALALIPNPDLTNEMWLYHQLLEMRDHFKAISQGAAQQNISKEKVARARALIAPPQLHAKFDSVVRPLWDLARILTAEDASLRTTRDLLLPRLISGEIDVENLDIAMPDVAA
jgi:type I restriction enzyme S subunit